MLGGELDGSFRRWLFRPYLDLEPAVPMAPYHLAGIDLSFRSLVEDRRYPHIQACFNPSFRKVLIRDTGLSGYDVNSPLELPQALQSERWNMLCEAIRGFDVLPLTSQVRLSWTLSKMCFQQVAVELIPPSCNENISKSDDHAGLAFVRAYSRYRMNVDNANSPYSISEITRIATEAPPGINCIDANYQVVVQHVKHFANLAAVEHWQERHREAIDRSRALLDDFTYGFVMSRYYRVGGFIPQMQRRAQDLVAQMDLAEEYALALPKPNDIYRTASGEVLYPVLESRTKEALWLGDTELALGRIRRAVDLAPHDSRVWLQLGEVHLERDEPELALAAYLRAARFAPPGREVAWFMAGQCFEALDDLESACDAYLAALEADPMGISAAEQLEVVASQLGHSTLNRWLRPRLEHLRKLEADIVEPHTWPYKYLPPPIDQTPEKAAAD